MVRLNLSFALIPGALGDVTLGMNLAVMCAASITGEGRLFFQNIFYFILKWGKAEWLAVAARRKKSR